MVIETKTPAFDRVVFSSVPEVIKLSMGIFSFRLFFFSLLQSDADDNHVVEGVFIPGINQP